MATTNRPVLTGRRKNSYRVTVWWTHRRWGPQFHKTHEEGSSARRALNKALLSFFSDKNHRADRADAHAHLRAEICREKKTK